MKTLTIIGGGMGTQALLTGEARAAIASAQRVYAPPRLAQALGALSPAMQGLGYAEILEELCSGDSRDAAVVVSGDVGFFSLSSALRDKLGDSWEIRCINGLSSLQMLCGRLGISYQGLPVYSTHGRSTSLLGPVSYNRRIFVLTGGEGDTKRILRELAAAGLGDVQVTVGESLGGAEERIFSGTASELANSAFGELAVLLLENHRAANPARRLRDEDFTRGDVPMTKEPVRALAVHRLEIAPGDVVYDIGAGTGSVAIALAHRAREGLVYAVERNEEGAALIRRNSHSLGAHNVVVVPGNAPQVLEELPPPDKVFVGGSGRALAGIVNAVQGKAERFTLCVNAITLESVGTALRCLEEGGFADIEVECVNVSAARAVGGYHMMTAQNPVYIISGRWAK